MPTTGSTRSSGPRPRVGGGIAREGGSERPVGLEFPCAYPLKVMGAVGSDFEARAFEIVGRHVPGLDRSLVESRASREGRYVSYTFRFTATSRGQLEELYADLNQCEQVKAVL